MSGRSWLARALLLACLAAAAISPAAARDPDPETIRLQSALDALDSDPALADKAGLERLKARQALAALLVARSRDRAHALYLAETWTAAATEAAQAEVLARQSAQLDRERDQILLEASRREAEMARREADQLRLQALAREEESQRLAESIERDRLAAEQSVADADAANAQASQTLKLADARAHETELARKEAELAAAVATDSLKSEAAPPPSKKVAGRTIYTLPGSAFASGSAALSASAQFSLRRLAGMLGHARTLRIEAHTDNQGADAANLALSQRRAESVRQALVAGGLPTSRLKAVGKGESSPLADNASAEGRARNRRVEIVVQ